jgi:hypothetical protein
VTTLTTAAGNTPGRLAPGPILAAQLTAIEALVVIGRTFAHLPGADLQIGPIYPDVLTVSLHDNLDGFEQWRTVLGVPAAEVDHQQRPGRAHMTLKASTTFHGVTVELVGYAPALPEAGR